jgi:quinol monooxygenase YgiN
LWSIEGCRRIGLGARTETWKAWALQEAGWEMTESRAEPIIRIAELDIDPNHIDSYKALLAEEIEASVRDEPGVLFLHAVSVKGTPENVRVIECYADQAAYEAHLTTPHFLKYKTQTANMVRSLRLIETDLILLGAKTGKIQTETLPKFGVS